MDSDSLSAQGIVTRIDCATYHRDACVRFDESACKILLVSCLRFRDHALSFPDGLRKPADGLRDDVNQSLLAAAEGFTHMKRRKHVIAAIAAVVVATTGVFLLSRQGSNWLLTVTSEPAQLVTTPKVKVTPAQRLPGDYDGFEPTVAADDAGRIVVVAINAQWKGAQDLSHMVLWRSTDGRGLWSEAQQLHPRPDESRYQGDPWLQTDRRGAFYVTYLKYGGLGGLVSAIQKSDDGGKTWKLPKSVDNPEFANHDKPVLAISPDGGKLVLGSIVDKSVGVYALHDGGQKWELTPSSPVSKMKEHVLPTGLVVTNQGVIALAWVSYSETENANRVAISLDGGNNWTLKTVDGNHQRDALDATGPALAHSASGLHLVTVRCGKKGGPQSVHYRHGLKGDEWSEPVELAGEKAGVSMQYPIIAAFGSRVHAAWVEGTDAWLNVWYRGSSDGGKTWSDRLLVSAPERPTTAMTARGFRDFAGHYMSIAEDGRGTAQIVWGARESGRARGEIWHACVSKAD